MRILHVASFVGNIGDNASHQGFYKVLDNFFKKYEVTQLEIRKFYKNYQQPDKQFFNLKFIDLANQFDLLIIGGGGFLDYWVKDSATGTTIDIDPNLIAKLTVSTLITSVGCMPHKEIPEGNIDKFRRFLDALIDNPKVLIALRNDGSLSAIKRDVGEKYIPHLNQVLDSGFFYKNTTQHESICKTDYVAINITNDQIEMTSQLRGAINLEDYYLEMVKIVEHILSKGLKIVFVPHIYSDLFAISILLAKLNDFAVREKIIVAPCIQGVDGCNALMSIYKNSVLTIGTRFHTNVCGMALGINVIGLAAIDRVLNLYESLSMQHYCVLLQNCFSLSVIELVDEIVSMPHSQLKQIESVLALSKQKSLNTYKGFFRYLKVIENE